MSTGWLLALDTSTERLALALGGPVAGDPAWTHEEAGGAAASARLLPGVHALLAQAGGRLGDVRAIAFGRGPGAFTGLRTACAVAQGLGFGLGRPLLPVDSLLIVAEDARRQRAPAQRDTAFDVAVALDARMHEAYAGRWHWQPGAGWQVLEAAALWSAAALAAHWAAAPPAAAAGSALTAFAGILRLPAATPRFEMEHDRPAALLALARAAHAAGAGIAAEDALPVYVRDKVAQTSDERAAARQATTEPPTAAGAAAPGGPGAGEGPAP